MPEHPEIVDRATWQAARGGTQVRTDGRPNAQWSRLAAGFPDGLQGGPVGEQ